jgi:hypothetical protein
MVPQKQVKVNVLNLSDSENFGFVEKQHVFKGSWATLWENESSTCRTALSSTHPEYSQVLLNKGVLRATHPQTPRVYCIVYRKYTSDSKTKTDQK